MWGKYAAKSGSPDLTVRLNFSSNFYFYTRVLFWFILLLEDSRKYTHFNQMRTQPFRYNSSTILIYFIDYFPLSMFVLSEDFPIKPLELPLMHHLMHHRDHCSTVDIAILRERDMVYQEFDNQKLAIYNGDYPTLN